MSEINPLLSLKNINVDFTWGTLIKRKVRILENINLDLGMGEVVGIVGESGCGKTTLGKVAAGLIKPSSGSVIYKGKSIYEDKNHYTLFRREVQIIHQDPYSSLNPAHTIYTILSRPMLKHGIANQSDVESKIIEILEMVGLIPGKAFLNKYPHQLSGGQRQRVAIARAISIRPKVLVADEPVSMIDVSMRIGILELLKDLKEKFNMSILYITHDLATLRYIATMGRVIVMYLGKIVEEATIDEIIENPLHPYTQLLLAALPEPDPEITRKKELPKLRSLDIPSIARPPLGCRFHTRCPFAMDICSKSAPELIEIKKNHKAACFLYMKR